MPERTQVLKSRKTHARRKRFHAALRRLKLRIAASLADGSLISRFKEKSTSSKASKCRGAAIGNPLHQQRRDNPFEVGRRGVEVCERRLVFSAQPLVEIFADSLFDNSSVSPAASNAESVTGLELHVNDLAPREGSLDSFDGSIPAILPSNGVGLETHLREAHAASGWNQVQQQFGLTGAGQTVAVIDSGIAYDHTAFGGGLGPGYRVVGGWDFTEENDAQPYDDGPSGFHGTHVAGIIGSDDSQNTGVAPDVDLVALRVFNDFGQGQLAWVEKALQWVNDNKDSFENPITTVNLSLGTTWNSDDVPSWATLEDEFQALEASGIVVVASAGNSFQSYGETGLSYPAASPSVLPVASVGDDGLLSDFSQRNDRVLAAPGENIISSVPDHVFGQDGQINDFGSASGTSMAAPYVAGASVLVRQAMEMVNFPNINLDTITAHLNSTADTVFDSFTNAYYNRLNLENAIDALIPDDTVGDTAQSGMQLGLSQSTVNGWINSIGDQDVYTFTAEQSGQLSLDASSQWLSDLTWTLNSSSGQPIGSDASGGASFEVVAGQSYSLNVGGNGAIGSFQLDVGFTPSSQGGSIGSGGEAEGGANVPVNLGSVDYLDSEIASDSRVRLQATRDGIFTVQWSPEDASSIVGNEVLYGGIVGAGDALTDNQSDSSWEAGSLRLDFEVQAGDWIDVQLPSHGNVSGNGNLLAANVLENQAGSWIVHGTAAADDLEIDLQNGVLVSFGDVDYSLGSEQVDNLVVQDAGNNDTLRILGSTGSDAVELTPGYSTLQNQDLRLEIAGVEEVHFDSGGGADRVYLYDSDTNDTLFAYPREARLEGVGYRFEVHNSDRIFMHATGGGEDLAYLYDSAGDDKLTVRPQFSSIRGDDFFNYVRGFERVYAYANAGGIDQADLYDSAGDDRFATSGAAASVVGPGFSSFTRNFEEVDAFATAGGSDLATLYGSSQQTEWLQGSDFVRFAEDGWQREARSFESVAAYVSGSPHSLSAGDLVTQAGLKSVDTSPLVDESNVEISSGWGSTAPSFDSFYAAPFEGEPVWDQGRVAFSEEVDLGISDRGTAIGSSALTGWDSDPTNESTVSAMDLEQSSVLESGELSVTEFRVNELGTEDTAVETKVLDWTQGEKVLPGHERLMQADEKLLAEPSIELEILDEIFRLKEELA